MGGNRVRAKLAVLDRRLRHRAQLLRLQLSGDARDRLLAHAIRDAKRLATQPHAFAAIEQERAALAQRTDPLVDGTLTVEGPYDRGTVGEAEKASKRPIDARLLYSIVRAFEPRTVIELGTNIGISGAYIATALRDAGEDGHLTTLEGSPYRMRLAQTLHSTLGLNKVSYCVGLFTDTLQDVLNSIPPVDVAFIDGHHQYEPTLHYFDLIAKHASPDCVFIFDDIGWSDGMKKAWRELRADPRLPISIACGAIGVALKKA